MLKRNCGVAPDGCGPADISFRCGGCGSADGDASFFAGADSDAFGEVEYEDFAVADVAGFGACDDGVDGFGFELLVNGDFDADLFEEVHGEGCAAVVFFVAHLLSASEGGHDGHFVDAVVEECLLHVVKLVGLYVSDDKFHWILLYRIPEFCLSGFTLAPGLPLREGRMGRQCVAWNSLNLRSSVR